MSRSSEVARRTLTLLKRGPLSFYSVLRALEDEDYRTILQAWGSLRERDLVTRDGEGNYLAREDPAS